jgi:aspartate carbamoyltransferase catalytic subunit
VSLQHLISIEDLEHDEVVQILDTAEELLPIAQRQAQLGPDAARQGRLQPLPRGLDPHPHQLRPGGQAPVGGGDQLLGEGLVGVEGRVVQGHRADPRRDGGGLRRGPLRSSGAPLQLSHYLDVPILNAGDGWHQHPTQALLDVFTMRRHLGDLAGRKVAVVGDILHSRVARSEVQALTLLGAEVVLVAPPTLLPPAVERWGATVATDLDAVLPEIDVLYLLRVQRERMSSAFFPSTREYARIWGVDRRRLDLLKPDALVMHPGPMNRGVEISGDVADSDRSVITEQVTNGIAVRMAVLYLLLAGAGRGEAELTSEVAR